MKNKKIGIIENEFKQAYRKQGECLVNNQKDWENFVDTLKYNSTDVLYTLISLQLLKDQNWNHGKLYNYLCQLKPDKKKIDIEYPIFKAAKLSIYKNNLLEEFTELYGVIETKEELEFAINKTKNKGKRRCRKK